MQRCTHIIIMVRDMSADMDVVRHRQHRGRHLNDNLPTRTAIATTLDTMTVAGAVVEVGYSVNGDKDGIAFLVEEHQ